MVAPARERVSIMKDAPFWEDVRLCVSEVGLRTPITERHCHDVSLPLDGFATARVLR